MFTSSRKDKNDISLEVFSETVRLSNYKDIKIVTVRSGQTKKYVCFRLHTS